MTCKREGCLNNTRHPNRSECWKNGLCESCFWGNSNNRYRRKNARF